MRPLAALALIAALAGCTPRAPESAPAEGAARAQQLIESGNAAFEAGDFDLAAKRYAAAAVNAPDDPASYFGLGMALAKLGRDEEARTAYAKARELARRQR